MSESGVPCLEPVRPRDFLLDSLKRPVRVEYRAPERDAFCSSVVVGGLFKRLCSSCSEPSPLAAAKEANSFRQRSVSGT